MTPDVIAVNAGSAFVLSSSTGDIHSHTSEGFYAYDTRFLSTFRITINSRDLSPLGTVSFNSSLASFYSTLEGGKNLPRSSISIVRDRMVESGFHEDIALVNHNPIEISLHLVMILDADFADVFQVRGHRTRKGGRVKVEQGENPHMLFLYDRGLFHRETGISFSQRPVISGKRASFGITLAPKGSWKTCVEVRPGLATPVPPTKCVRLALGEPFGNYQRSGDVPIEKLTRHVEKEPFRSAPRLETEHLGIQQAYNQSLSDLQALTIEENGHSILAAGLPWFMAIFGRDSILSAIQTKLLGPQLMEGTLNILAARQADKVDKFRESEPGKIPHEVRRGELSLLEEVPHSRYYGSVDATPLFLRLLHEAFEWTGDIALLRGFLPAAERALAWIDRYGDVDGDGFVEYMGKSRKGLRNQCWKDSWDSIAFSEGTLAEGPIAVAEVQGYVYDAKVRLAAIYRVLEDDVTAQRLEKEAQQLKRSFNDAFWMPDEGFYALALDGRKRQVDSIASNAGHCLWSGIVDEDKARPVVDRLRAPDMSSGWGVRTLSTEMSRYNPLSYHNGSVWPHDTAIIVAGMARYGFVGEAQDVAYQLFEAIEAFPSQRPPELFAGYPRREYSGPMPYPAANAPQAWASGAVVYMLETILGLTPSGDRLLLEAQSEGASLSLHGIYYRGRRLFV